MNTSRYQGENKVRFFGREKRIDFSINGEPSESPSDHSGSVVLRCELKVTADMRLWELFCNGIKEVQGQVTSFYNCININRHI